MRCGVTTSAFAAQLGKTLSPASVRSGITVLGLVLREAIDERWARLDGPAK